DRSSLGRRLDLLQDAGGEGDIGYLQNQPRLLVGGVEGGVDVIDGDAAAGERGRRRGERSSARAEGDGEHRLEGDFEAVFGQDALRARSLGRGEAEGARARLLEFE